MEASNPRGTTPRNPSQDVPSFTCARRREFRFTVNQHSGKLLVVLVDNAGWHVAKRLEIPPNVLPHRLPPRTSELQPVEPLWPLVREAVANEGYNDLEELRNSLVERCLWLMDHAETVRGAVGFGWAAANG